MAFLCLTILQGYLFQALIQTSPLPDKPLLSQVRPVCKPALSSPEPSWLPHSPATPSSHISSPQSHLFRSVQIAHPKTLCYQNKGPCPLHMWETDSRCMTENPSVIGTVLSHIWNPLWCGKILTQHEQGNYPALFPTVLSHSHLSSSLKPS